MTVTWVIYQHAHVLTNAFFTTTLRCINYNCYLPVCPTQSTVQYTGNNEMFRYAQLLKHLMPEVNEHHAKLAWLNNKVKMQTNIWIQNSIQIADLYTTIRFILIPLETLLLDPCSSASKLSKFKVYTHSRCLNKTSAEAVANKGITESVYSGLGMAVTCPGYWCRNIIDLLIIVACDAHLAITTHSTR